jgi:hypothetical protein
MNPFDTLHTADVTQHAIQAVQNGNGPEYVKQLATSGSALEIAKVDPRMRAQTPDGKNGEADGRTATLAVAMALIPAVKALRALRAAAPTTRAITAADLGLSGKGITNIAGTVTDAGTTRIISVTNITATRGALLPELRAALPKILAAARADGVKTLQINASFANADLALYVAKQAGKYGGTFASVGGQDVLTFIAGAGL